MISAFSIFRIPTSFFLFVALLNWITPTPVGATHSRLKRSSCRPKRTSDGAALTATFSGKGTHNPDDWGSGNCAFTKWPRPAGFGAVAMASNQWNSSGICGACLEITGSGGTFKGIVGNQCPSCEPNGLDLDTDIWNQVSGHKDFGIIQLTWKIIPCGFSGPILFMNKVGTSQYWNSVQTQGANTPVTSLEVSTDSGSSWIAFKRKTESNYFQPRDDKGLGNTGDIRVTCLSGKQFVTKKLDLATPENPTSGSGNC